MARALEFLLKANTCWHPACVQNLIQDHLLCCKLLHRLQLLLLLLELCCYCIMQIGLETISVVMCTLMFASIIKTGQHYISEDEEAEFLDKARNFALKYM